MRQKRLIGAPVLLKIAAQKSEPPAQRFLELAANELDYAAFLATFNKVTIENFETFDEETQNYFVDCYKLWQWFLFWSAVEPPAKWQVLKNLFDKEE